MTKEELQKQIEEELSELRQYACEMLNSGDGYLKLDEVYRLGIKSKAVAQFHRADKEDAVRKAVELATVTLGQSTGFLYTLDEIVAQIMGDKT